MRKFLWTTLLALFIASIVFTPVFAQDQMTITPQAEGVKYLSKSEMQRMMQTVPIRQRFTTPPPPPQKYWVIYISDIVILVCKHSDKTGELIYCDVYA